MTNIVHIQGKEIALEPAVWHNGLKTVRPYKSISTGTLHRYYRQSGNFILREKVLHGFSHAFLDGVDLFGIGGSFIGSVYRIRESRWSSSVSKDIVTKLLRDFLYSKHNIDATLEQTISGFYQQGGKTDNELVSRFIALHEK